MRGLQKIAWGGDTQTDTQTHRHRDSMKESAKGRFFENLILRRYDKIIHIFQKDSSD